MENEYYGYIYKTTCLVNDKIYVGKHTKFKNYYIGSGTILRKAIKKYGKENFSKEILHYCIDLKTLDLLETFYIRKHKSTNPEIGYNIKLIGGQGGNLSEDTKRKISSKMKGVPKNFTKEWRDKITKAITGRKLSEDHKEKMSTALKGKPLMEETKIKIGMANKGHKVSIEVRKKISIANTGRICTEETRQAISKFHKGRKRSEETILKMKEAQKLRPSVSEETKKKLKEAWKTRSHEVSKETREKISKTTKGRIGMKLSEETKKKLSKLLTGRKLSEEHKKKMRDHWTEEKKRNFVERMRKINTK